MTSTDPIADMLTRIRNALAVNKIEQQVPYSTLKYELAKELQKVGYLRDVKVEGDGTAKAILLTLRSEDQPSPITEIERGSKPGRRLYSKADKIPRVMNGRGIMIVSTSKGLMTDTQARKERVGGELICKVY